MYIEKLSPDILSVLDVYISEAKFGRRYIDYDLATLAPGAVILEVGAGALLLSCQLVREGFRVTALEPVGVGFSHFNQIRSFVIDFAKSQDCLPIMLNQAAEQLCLIDCFDYAFSINVMEHVVNVPKVIVNVSKCLKIGAQYRFTCANYLFPYEPHFNIPTLFSKSLTEKVFRKQIYSNVFVDDPGGVWKSLNWITVRQVVQTTGTNSDISVSFDRAMLRSLLLRVVNDPQFSRRRSPLVRSIVKIIVRIGLDRVAQWIPAFLQPMMDCTITRQPVRTI